MNDDEDMMMMNDDDNDDDAWKYGLITMSFPSK